MTERVVAIDGPAASGKSTTAHAVAERLELPHVESGALYRALTLAALDADVELSGQKLVALAKALPVRLDFTTGGGGGLDRRWLARMCQARFATTGSRPACQKCLRSRRYGGGSTRKFGPW